MKLKEEGDKVVIEYAYAKVNLTLNVLAKKDGYHEIETIIAPIDLCDILTFEESDSLEVIGLDIENNSIIKAAQLFMATYHTPPCKITVEKNIPIEAGLGGGSADSSATLRGMNRLFNLKKSYFELEKLANQLGSDNAFCLYNKLAICRGRGEKLEFIKKPFIYHLLLIKPNFGLSTKLVYENVEIKSNRIDSYEMLKIINDYHEFDNKIVNDLFDSAIKLDLRMKSLYDKIKAEGFVPHMTGSGSCFFVLLKRERLDLESIEKIFEGNFIKLCLIKNCF